MMMHTAALCCVGPFSVGVAKYVVLFLFFFSFGTSESPIWWYMGKREGQGERHRAQYGQDGKGHFGNDDKRVCMSTHLRGRIDYEGISQSQSVYILATETPLRKRNYVLLLLVLKRERQHMHCCCDCMKRRIEAHYCDEYELLGIFWNIYIAKCGSTSCLKEASFFLACALLFVKWRGKVVCTIEAGHFIRRR